MRAVFLVFLFYFGTVSFCKAQIDTNFNNCQILESVVNDSAVKKFLFSREHFIGFTNSTKYFRGCNSLSIEGKNYKVYDSIGKAMLEGYPPIDIYVQNENNDDFFIVLDYVPQEQGANIEVKKRKCKYIITLNEIFRED
jgi:hypothetical protein